MNIYFALSLVLCYAYISDACDGNANAFIDEVLANARPDLAQHLVLADVDDGALKMSGITVWGFDSLQRAGDFCFESLGDGKERISAEIEVFNLHGSVAKGSYKETVKVLGVKVSHTFDFHVDVEIPHVKVRLAIDADLNARQTALSDFAFEVFDNAKFNIHLSGILKILDGIANHLADKYGNKELKPKAEEMIHNTLAAKLSSFQNFDLIPH